MSVSVVMRVIFALLVVAVACIAAGNRSDDDGLRAIGRALAGGALVTLGAAAAVVIVTDVVEMLW